MQDYDKPMTGATEAPRIEPREDPWKGRSLFMRCRTCIFYVRKGERKLNQVDRGVGRCRRHAPIVQLGYPAVYADDWCGDHKLDENKS